MKIQNTKKTRSFFSKVARKIPLPGKDEQEQTPSSTGGPRAWLVYFVPNEMGKVGFRTQLSYHSKAREKGIHFQAETHSQALVKRTNKKSLRKVATEPGRERINPEIVSKDGEIWGRPP